MGTRVRSRAHGLGDCIEDISPLASGLAAIMLPDLSHSQYKSGFILAYGFTFPFSSISGFGDRIMPFEGSIVGVALVTLFQWVCYRAGFICCTRVSLSRCTTKPSYF